MFGVQPLGGKTERAKASTLYTEIKYPKEMSQLMSMQSLHRNEIVRLFCRAKILILLKNALKSGISSLAR